MPCRHLKAEMKPRAATLTLSSLDRERSTYFEWALEHNGSHSLLLDGRHGGDVGSGNCETLMACCEVPRWSREP
jgi:hypothetical protein